MIQEVEVQEFIVPLDRERNVGEKGGGEKHEDQERGGEVRAVVQVRDHMT